MVPYPPNVFFTGREEELSLLHQAITGEGVAAITQAIQGLGGVGKTQLAVEYAHKHQNKYGCVLWSLADTRDNLQSSFIQIADKLNLREKNEAEQDKVVQAVVRWMEATSDYLLILDNADEPGIFKDFLPRKPAGRVLLTSRAHNFAGLNIRSPIRLETLPEDKAIEFLLARAEREDASESEQQSAKLLAEELGGLPLALEQAAAYIANESATFQAYLQSYRTRKLGLLEEYGPEAGPHKDSVRATWSLNMQSVQKVSQPAADLLNVCAFVNSERIPFELVAKGAKALGIALASVLHVEENDPLAVNRLLKPLLRYSLIQVDIDAQTFSIHRLVQEVVREQLSEVGQRTWTERVVKALLACNPGNKHTAWTACERLRTHWLVCEQHIERLHIENDEAAEMLNQAGYYLDDRAEYTQAEPLMRQALTIRLKVWGDEHPSTAASFNNLALLYVNQGRYAEAEPLYQQAQSIYQNVLGDEHPTTARILNNVAELYRTLGRYKEAEPLMRQALAIQKKVLGDDHLDTANSLNNLALLYCNQGRAEEAESLYQMALTIRKNVLGGDHLDSATSLNNLAFLYFKQGRYEEAEPLMRQALLIHQTVLGETHPTTATSLNNLAELYHTLGKYEKAEQFFRQALTICQTVLGDDHLDTAGSLNNLAALYYNQGRYEEAEPLMRQSLAIHQKVLEYDHIDNASSLNNLAFLYFNQGRYEEAEPLYQQALTIYQKVLGDEHPVIKAVRDNLKGLQPRHQ